MGTWGTGPFDSDSAGDFVASLHRHVARLADYQLARAVTQILLLAHGTDILGGPSLVEAGKALVRIRSDVEWLAGWKSPRRIARQLELELDQLVAAMRTCDRRAPRRYRRHHRDEIELLRKLRAALPPVPKRRAPSKGRKTRRRRAQ